MDTVEVRHLAIQVVIQLGHDKNTVEEMLQAAAKIERYLYMGEETTIEVEGCLDHD